MSLLAAFGRAVTNSRLSLLGSLKRVRNGWKEEVPRNHEPRRAPDTPTEMVAIIGLDGVFKSVSPACEALLGYDPEELVGRSYIDVVDPDDRERSGALTAAVACGMAEVRFENLLRRKDGSPAPIEWSAAILPEEDALYCLGREVTDRNGEGRSEEH